MAKKTAKKAAKKSNKSAAGRALAPDGAKRSAVKATQSKPSKKSAKKSAVVGNPLQSPDGSTKELLKKLRGAPPNDQDVKRRIGNFEGAGEPPRRGSRTTGIGGQSKQKFKTDKSQGAKGKN